jgi:SAM-dependent methyltransferase
MSLWSLFNANDGKAVFKWTHYLPIYEKHFSRYVNRPLNILEIGCLHGGSLQMWKKYLGPYANIVAIDIDPAAMAHEEDQISVRIGDQSNRLFLESVLAEFGDFDIVIDDGSHICEHQLQSFKVLYSHVKDDGIYVVEDLHTNYWPEYGGGYKKDSTFIEMAKNLIDELNAYHTRGAVEVNEFTNSTYSMNFYDSMIIFEKGRLLRRHDLIVGKDAEGHRQWQEKQSIPYVKTR